jgi:hypothetical protein
MITWQITLNWASFINFKSIEQTIKQKNQTSTTNSKKLPTDLLIQGGKTSSREKQILNAIYILK